MPGKLRCFCLFAIFPFFLSFLLYKKYCFTENWKESTARFCLLVTWFSYKYITTAQYQNQEIDGGVTCLYNSLLLCDMGRGALFSSDQSWAGLGHCFWKLFSPALMPPFYYTLLLNQPQLASAANSSLC